jgi:hypothetical protein
MRRERVPDAALKKAKTTALYSIVKSLRGLDSVTVAHMGDLQFFLFIEYQLENDITTCFLRPSVAGRRKHATLLFICFHLENDIELIIAQKKIRAR